MINVKVSQIRLIRQPFNNNNEFTYLIYYLLNDMQCKLVVRRGKDNIHLVLNDQDMCFDWALNLINDVFLYNKFKDILNGFTVHKNKAQFRFNVNDL